MQRRHALFLALTATLAALPAASQQAKTPPTNLYIDVATHKKVGETRDEHGTKLFSEKELDMTFQDGHLQRVSNQFANEYGDFVTAEKMGVGPHVPVLPGRAKTLATPTGKDPNAGVKWMDTLTPRGG